jgi:hypothetical protein
MNEYVIEVKDINNNVRYIRLNREVNATEPFLEHFSAKYLNKTETAETVLDTLRFIFNRTPDTDALIDRYMTDEEMIEMGYEPDEVDDIEEWERLCDLWNYDTATIEDYIEAFKDTNAHITIYGTTINLTTIRVRLAKKAIIILD